MTIDEAIEKIKEKQGEPMTAENISKLKSTTYFKEPWQENDRMLFTMVYIRPGDAEPYGKPFQSDSEMPEIGVKFIMFADRQIDRIKEEFTVDEFYTTKDKVALIRKENVGRKRVNNLEDI